MAGHTGYIFDTDVECDRLERQALLQGPGCVLRHFAPGPGARILDAGSGSGATARLLAATFPQAEVVGVDLNPGYVTHARRLAAAEGLTNLTFRVGNLTELPFEPASFDVVWSQYVLYFVPDPAAALAELRRVARPGGRVIVRTHEQPMTVNHPEDPRLQPLIEALADAALGGWRGKQLPSLFRGAGLLEVDLEVETDRVYTILGAIEAGQRRNVEQVVAGPIRRLAHLFGGTGGAEAFLRDWLAYLDRDDTVTVTTCWVATGRVPPAV